MLPKAAVRAVALVRAALAVVPAVIADSLKQWVALCSRLPRPDIAFDKDFAMIKKTAVTAALFVSVLSASAIAAPPADQDACNKLSFSLAEKAVAKTPSEAQAVKIDELIGKLEGQCNESKFAEAEATAKEVEALIGK